MKRSIIAPALLAGVCLLTGAGSSRADLLTVLNPGFELGGGSYAFPPNWVVEGEFRTYVNDLSGQLLPPTGTDIGAISGFTAGGAASAYQVIGGTTMAANTTYTLNVLVGGRLESSGFNFSGSTISLFDADTSAVLASYTLHGGRGTGVLDGVFEPQAVSFSTGLAGGPIGDRLGIRLAGLGDGEQTWFDNVRVEATPSAVPEPAGLLVLGTGLVAAFGLGRRRRSPARHD